jgi:A/G-specific adenine glycosylase
VAELLLKRTTATAARRVYEAFINEFPSIRAIADSPEDNLATALAKVGLQWQRARAIKALALHLIEVEVGEIPCDLGRLLAVPGLGEYSARAVLSFGFGIPSAVVDANVERVLTRVFQDALPRRPSQRLLQEIADDLVPREFHRDYNLGLLDLGALICRYVDPLCEECPLSSICDYYNRNKTRLIKEAPGKYETATGARLREIRKAKGVGLVNLARLSGVSKLTIIRIESGKTTPRPETLRKLAAALQVGPEQLQC